MTDTEPGGVQVSKQHSLDHFYAKARIFENPEALKFQNGEGLCPFERQLTGNFPLKIPPYCTF